MKEKNLKRILLLLIAILIVLGVILAYNLGRTSKTKIVHVNFSETKTELITDSYKYPFLSQELSNYIENLTAELGVDPDLVVAILMKENPSFDANAVHENNNGTFDVGLFQQNDRYVWSDFVPNYWDFKDIEYNPFNWKHNTFIAIHHIEYLVRTLKIPDDYIAAYNAGITSVISGKIPTSTRNYVAAVKNNLVLLKKGIE